MSVFVPLSVGLAIINLFFGLGGLLLWDGSNWIMAFNFAVVLPCLMSAALWWRWPA